MFEFLNHADIYLQTFWYIAIPVSMVFLFQAIMTFAGMGMDMDISDDFHLEDPSGVVGYFTIRNGINFLLGFSWAGIIFHPTISNKFFLIIAAIAVGIVFLTLYFYLAEQVRKFEEDNTFNPTELVDKEAKVYLKIPANGLGYGKITVSHKGTSHELDAYAENVECATGATVIIKEINAENQIVVSALEP
jgi:ABC-type transport system involved in cytochrome c biogenesis permease subunit